MGIEGIQSFVEKYGSPADSRQRQNIIEVIRENASAGRAARVAIDASALLFWRGLPHVVIVLGRADVERLYSSPYSVTLAKRMLKSTVCTAIFERLPLYYDALQTFFGYFVANGIGVDLWFDGPAPESKYQTRLSRHKERVRISRRAWRQGENSSLPAVPHSEARDHDVYPVQSHFGSAVIREAARRVAADRRFASVENAVVLHACNTEADTGLAAVWHANRCGLVIGNDTDFLVHGCPYVHPEKIIARHDGTLHAPVNEQSQLVAALKLRDPGLLPLVAAMIGNDHNGKEARLLVKPKRGSATAAQQGAETKADCAVSVPMSALPRANTHTRLRHPGDGDGDLNGSECSTFAADHRHNRVFDEDEVDENSDVRERVRCAIAHIPQDFDIAAAAAAASADVAADECCSGSMSPSHQRIIRIVEHVNKHRARYMACETSDAMASCVKFVSCPFFTDEHIAAFRFSLARTIDSYSPSLNPETAEIPDHAPSDMPGGERAFALLEGTAFLDLVVRQTLFCAVHTEDPAAPTVYSIIRPLHEIAIAMLFGAGTVVRVVHRTCTSPSKDKIEEESITTGLSSQHSLRRCVPPEIWATMLAPEPAASLPPMDQPPFLALLSRPEVDRKKVFLGIFEVHNDFPLNSFDFLAACVQSFLSDHLSPFDITVIAEYLRLCKEERRHARGIAAFLQPLYDQTPSNAGIHLYAILQELYAMINNFHRMLGRPFGPDFPPPPQDVFDGALWKNVYDWVSRQQAHGSQAQLLQAAQAPAPSPARAPAPSPTHHRSPARSASPLCGPETCWRRKDDKR